MSVSDSKMATHTRYNPDGSLTRIVECVPSHTLGVLDWGVIRGLPRENAEWIPSERVQGFLVDESTLTEAADASRIDGSQKLISFLSSYSKSIWFGRAVWDIHRQECKQNSPIAAGDFIHAEYSDKLQRILSLRDQVELSRSLKSECDLSAVRRHADTWTNDARSFGNLLAANYASSGATFPRSQSILDTIASDPKLGQWSMRFTTATPEKLGPAFLERPMDFALGRFIAIWMWYSIHSFLGGQTESNDWHDSHYLFLASYTGNLITNERSGLLARAAKSLFPKIQIYGSEAMFRTQAA